MFKTTEGYVCAAQENASKGGLQAQMYFLLIFFGKGAGGTYSSLCRLKFELDTLLAFLCVSFGSPFCMMICGLD